MPCSSADHGAIIALGAAAERVVRIAAGHPMDVREYLFAGYVNHFNAKIIVTREGEPSLKLRPKDDNLAVYQALARFGTSVDLAMFNLDLNYSISMNSATTTSYRAGYHQVQLNLAYVF